MSTAPPVRLHPVLRAILYLAAYVVVLSAVQTPVAGLWLALRFARAGSVEGLGSLDGLMEEALRSMMSLTWLLPLMLLQLAATLALTYVFRRFIDRQPLASLGLQRDPGWRSDLLAGAALGLIAMSVVFVLETGGGLAVARPAALSIPVLLLRLLGYVILYAAVAVAEELIFRGYVMSALLEWPGQLGAVVGSAVVFAVFHGLNPSINGLALFHLALAGLVFAYGRLATGRLWLPIGLHFAWNFFQGPVFGFPVSGVAPEGLLAVASQAGAWWVTGGAFGPEGGLVGLLGLGLCAAGILVYTRRRSALHLAA